MSTPANSRWVPYVAGATVFGGFVGLGAMLWRIRRPGYDRLLARTGAPSELKVLAAIQRYTESRGNPKTGLGRPELFPPWAEPREAPRSAQLAESDAAARGYQYSVNAYMESPYPRQLWIFGSGGPYGMLPSSALGPWRNTDAMRHGKVGPHDVFDPWRATVFFVDYARRLMQRADFRGMPREHQTIMALKRGMASPSLIDDYREFQARSRVSRSNATKAVAALGMREEVLDTPVPMEWPKYPGAKELVP